MMNVQLPAAWAAHWQLDRKLGTGGFSTVWRAVRRDMPSVMAAIKIISIPADESELDELTSMRMDATRSQAYYDNLARQYVSEIMLMENLKGARHVVSIEDYCVVRKANKIGNLIYIRMELLKPLSAELRGRFLTEVEAVQLGIDMCEALDICHSRNILHRDIKPANIFIDDRFQNRIYYKLGDFGIARTMLGAGGGMSIKGTPGYMAPEAFLGKDYDTRADLYSLGITLYQLMNRNRYPLMGERVTAEGKEQAISRRLQGAVLPPPVDCGAPLGMLILKACAYRPQDRYQTAAEMRAALERVRDKNTFPWQTVPKPAAESDSFSTIQTLRDQSDGPAVTPKEKKNNRGWMIASAAAGMMAIIGIAGFSLIQNGRPANPGGSNARTMTDAPGDLPSESPTNTEEEETENVRFIPAVTPMLRVLTEAPTMTLTETPTMPLTETPEITLKEAPAITLTEKPAITLTEKPAMTLTEAPAAETVAVTVTPAGGGKPQAIESVTADLAKAPAIIGQSAASSSGWEGSRKHKVPELPEFTQVSVKAGQNLPVYSGPTTRAWRGAKGKAVVSTNGAVYASGRTDKWLLISYEKNSGSIRVGYIEIRKLSGSVPNVPYLEFSDESVVVTVTSPVTDDPQHSSETLCTVVAGVKVTCLATYHDWAYIETITGTQPVRGFIPASAVDLE